MNWERPSPSELWKAINLYLQAAYDREPPSAVRTRLETLRSVPESKLFESPALEPDNPSSPTRLSLRLGNRFYPHMKLVIERTPDGKGYLFRADTHDRHACPAPGSREHAAFCQLMELNQNIAQAIETTWEQERLPTFKAYLRQDLARRATKPTQTSDENKKT